MLKRREFKVEAVRLSRQPRRSVDEVAKSLDNREACFYGDDNRDINCGTLGVTIGRPMSRKS